jgi:hypothetical protein
MWLFRNCCYLKMADSRQAKPRRQAVDRANAFFACRFRLQVLLRCHGASEERVDLIVFWNDSGKKSGSEGVTSESGSDGSDAKHVTSDHIDNSWTWVMMPKVISCVTYVAGVIQRSSPWPPNFHSIKNPRTKAPPRPILPPILGIAGNVWFWVYLAKYGHFTHCN